ncbi:hypothetical protein EGM_20708 [Macaca fascicularis]|uniref:Protein phosphatase 1 regulatory subunit 14 n=1 Tax=Macaca fascicularis TaxID=9541 RepID=G8F528_MACFA|nr:hypothetical protein EGM_20708 [Macaca fascicularis]
MLGRHICWVPSPRSPALAVWPCLAPPVPTGRDRKLPPHPALGSLPWHGPDLFSSSEQLPLCLLGRGPGSSEVGRGLNPSLQLRLMSLPPPPPPPQEEEIPELEIDVDELLDMESDDARAARVKELLVDCYKPTEAFISGLLDKIRGMQKLSTPQKK